MVNDSESAPEPNPPAPAWLKWARLFLLLAMAGAGYLAWVSLHHGPVAGCGTESGCNKVLQSRWAYWLDFPVSIPALLVYLALLGATVLLQRRPSPDDQRGSWAAIIILSVVLAGAALWFVALQVFVIKAFCKFCMAAHVCGFVAACLCLKNIPFATEPDTPMWTPGSGKRGVPASAVSLLIVIGMCGIGALAGVQLLLPKQLNVVKVAPAAGNAAAGTDYLARAVALASEQHVGPLLPNPRLIAPRLLSLYSNKFQIKLDAVPLMGSPDAPKVVVCLFDYTCPHCRALHPILAQTQRRFGGRLAVVCLPMPVSTNCNHFLPSRIRSVPYACEYARLALAVWRAKPTVFHQFDDWVFAPEHPPPVEETRRYAAQLVGEDTLQAALADPWVDQQIALDCELHRDNSVAYDTPAIPQLLIGPAISAGPLNSAENLEIMLSHYLGIEIPAAGGP